MNAVVSSCQPRQLRRRGFPLPVVLLVSVLLHAGLFALVRATRPHGPAVQSPALRVTLLARVVTPAATGHDVPAPRVHAAVTPVLAQASVGATRKVMPADRPAHLPSLSATVAWPREAAQTVAPDPDRTSATDRVVAAGGAAGETPGGMVSANVPPSQMQPAATAYEARSGWGARRQPSPMPPQAQDGRAAAARAVLQGVRDAVRASLSGALRELAAAGDGSCEVAVTDDAAAFESNCDSGALAQALAALSEPARQSVSGGMRAIGVQRLAISIAAGQADIALH